MDGKIGGYREYTRIYPTPTPLTRALVMGRTWSATQSSVFPHGGMDPRLGIFTPTQKATSRAEIETHQTRPCFLFCLFVSFFKLSTVRSLVSPCKFSPQRLICLQMGGAPSLSCVPSIASNSLEFLSSSCHTFPRQLWHQRVVLARRSTLLCQP